MVEIKKGKWYLVQLRFGCSRVREVAQCTSDKTSNGYYFNTYDNDANQFLICDYVVTERGDVIKEIARPVAFDGLPEDEIVTSN